MELPEAKGTYILIASIALLSGQERLEARLLKVMIRRCPPMQANPQVAGFATALEK